MKTIEHSFVEIFLSLKKNNENFQKKQKSLLKMKLKIEEKLKIDIVHQFEKELIECIKYTVSDPLNKILLAEFKNMDHFQTLRVNCGFHYFFNSGVLPFNEFEEIVKTCLINLVNDKYQNIGKLHIWDKDKLPPIDIFSINPNSNSVKLKEFIQNKIFKQDKRGDFVYSSFNFNKQAILDIYKKGEILWEKKHLISKRDNKAGKYKNIKKDLL